MHILIDAYNLIKRIYSADFISKGQIESCIEILAQYALLKNHMLVIVFDGGDIFWPISQDHSHLCRLWWVGSGLKADDFIKELLEEKFKYNLLVSCDRELVLYAQDKKIPSIEVAFFWEFVKKAVEASKQKDSNRKNNNQKTVSQNNGTIDALMDEFMFQGISKDTSAQESEIFVSKKHLSKFEIQLYAIIKKL